MSLSNMDEYSGPTLNEAAAAKPPALALADHLNDMAKMSDLGKATMEPQGAMYLRQAAAALTAAQARIAELEAHIARSTGLFDYLSRPDLDKPQVSSLHLWSQCMEAAARGRSLLAARAGIGASHEG